MRRDTSLPFPVFFQRFRSLLPFPQSKWDLVSDLSMTDKWYSRCFSKPSSLLQPRHFFSSDQLMSHNLFGTHPPSTTSFLHCGACLPTIRWSFFAAWLGLVPAALFLSTPHTRAWLPISSTGSSWLVSEASSSHPAGRPLSCPQPPTPQTARCATARSRVSHMTAPASPLTSLHVCTSKICFLSAFCCSFRHLFIQTPSAQKSVAMVDK